MVTRGIRNKNPFNLKVSANSWKGLLSVPDYPFERFCSMDYGLRAGILNLLNGYIRKGFDTPEKIINRYAPSSENDTHNYLMFIVTSYPLDYDTKICIGSMTFFWLCQAILRYESNYDLSYSKYCDVIKKFKLY